MGGISKTFISFLLAACFSLQVDPISTADAQHPLEPSDTSNPRATLSRSSMVNLSSDWGRCAEIVQVPRSYARSTGSGVRLRGQKTERSRMGTQIHHRTSVRRVGDRPPAQHDGRDRIQVEKGQTVSGISKTFVSSLLAACLVLQVDSISAADASHPLQPSDTSSPRATTSNN